MSDNTKSQDQVWLVHGHVGISGKGASGLQPLQPTRDLLWTLCGLWRGEGDLPGPHGLVAKTARARLVAH